MSVEQHFRAKLIGISKQVRLGRGWRQEGGFTKTRTRLHKATTPGSRPWGPKGNGIFFNLSHMFWSSDFHYNTNRSEQRPYLQRSEEETSKYFQCEHQVLTTQTWFLCHKSNWIPRSVPSSATAIAWKCETRKINSRDEYPESFCLKVLPHSQRTHLSA